MLNTKEQMSTEIKKYYKDHLIAHISTDDDYNDTYNNSISDSDLFWSKIAERISWNKRWDRVSDVDYTKAHIRWFEGGELSILHIEPFKSWSAWVWMLQARDSDLVILGPNAMNPEMPVPSRIIGRDKMSDLVFRLGTKLCELHVGEAVTLHEP